jgi:3-phenylpropionate/trans-cinnamate dioxygenase ferredoxin component
MAWQRAASLSEIEDNNPLGVTVGGKSIGLYRIEGKLYALDDICPHQYTLLSSGYLDGDAIECPLHQALFHVATGKCLAGPAERDVATYPVKIEGDNVLIDVP